MFFRDPSLGEFVVNASKTSNRGNANFAGPRNFCYIFIVLTSLRQANPSDCSRLTEHLSCH